MACRKNDGWRTYVLLRRVTVDEHERGDHAIWCRPGARVGVNTYDTVATFAPRSASDLNQTAIMRVQHGLGPAVSTHAHAHVRAAVIRIPCHAFLEAGRAYVRGARACTREERKYTQSARSRSMDRRGLASADEPLLACMHHACMPECAASLRATTTASMCR